VRIRAVSMDTEYRILSRFLNLLPDVRVMSTQKIQGQVLLNYNETPGWAG
jgi:hypothetical protein